MKLRIETTTINKPGGSPSSRFCFDCTSSPIIQDAISSINLCCFLFCRILGSTTLPIARFIFLQRITIHTTKLGQRHTVKHICSSTHTYPQKKKKKGGRGRDQGQNLLRKHKDLSTELAQRSEMWYHCARQKKEGESQCYLFVV